MKVSKILFLCLIVSLFLVGCTAKDGPPSDVENLYIAYLEKSKTDVVGAARDYCYNVNTDWDALNGAANDYTVDFEILKWEKLSEDLWVATTRITKTYHSTDEPYFHFIGKIQGRYLVIKNVRNIPENLKENLNLDPYIYKNENIVGP